MKLIWAAARYFALNDARKQNSLFTSHIFLAVHKSNAIECFIIFISFVSLSKLLREKRPVKRAFSSQTVTRVRIKQKLYTEKSNFWTWIGWRICCCVLPSHGFSFSFPFIKSGEQIDYKGAADGAVVKAEACKVKSRKVSLNESTEKIERKESGRLDSTCQQIRYSEKRKLTGLQFTFWSHRISTRRPTWRRKILKEGKEKKEKKLLEHKQSGI